MRRCAGWLGLVLAVAMWLAGAPAWAAAAVDPHAEVAAALFAASATQAAVEKAADAKLAAQRAEIVALAAKVRAGQARQAELTAAQESFVAELATKDRAYAAAIDAFRGAVTHITETPEGATALQAFNNGDEVGAIKILSQLNDARDAALQKASDIQKAVGRRDEAKLALDAHERDKIDSVTVIGLLEQVVKLDPGVSQDWVDLSRLYLAAGRLPNARTAAESAVKTASGDYDRLTALDDLDDVLTAQGDLQGVRKNLQEQVSLGEQLANAAPDDIQLQRDYAVTLQKAGDVFQSMGDLDHAQDAYRTSLTVTYTAAKAQPANGSLPVLLAEDLDDLGNVLASLGQADKARECYDGALQGARAFVATWPDNAQVRHLLFAILFHRGVLRDSQGDRAGAIADETEALGLAQDLAAADPGEVPRQIAVGGVQLGLGLLLNENDDPAAALARFQESEATFRRVVAVEPADVLAIRDLATVLSYEGDVLMDERGDASGAKAVYVASFSLLAPLIAAQPSDVDTNMIAANDVLNIARVEASAGDDAHAAKGYADAINLLRQVAGMRPGDLQGQSNLAAALGDEGEFRRKHDDATGARLDLTESLEITRKVAASDPKSVPRQRALADVLSYMAQLDNTPEAWTAAVAQWRALGALTPLRASDKDALSAAERHVPAVATPAAAAK